MRLSAIIAAHNEGASLWQTVRSCVDWLGAGGDYEIVVADDASDDGSVEEMLRRFPQVRVARHAERRGASPTKDLGAREARGDVLVFLDGHTNPQPGALLQLAEDVERVEGRAIVTPAIEALDVERWRNTPSQVGHGYRLDLETFDCGWLPLGELRQVRRDGRTFYESPALMGCALAVGRELYEELRGFDPHMRFWGVEDLDFGLKCWLMGYSILHDPEAVVGHRFRESFDNYDVPIEDLVANQLRMARKSFTHTLWSGWVESCRRRHSGRLADRPEGLWVHIWNQFEAERPSVEEERAYLLGHRVRDEFSYAEQFGLRWPRLATAPLAPLDMAFEAMAAAPSPSPSPPPPSVDIDIEGVPDDKEVTVGGVVVRRHDGNDAPRKEITLDSTATSGNVTLTRNSSRVKVFDAASGGTEITFDGTDNTFPVIALPKSLYVQGHAASGAMRDVTLTLTHDESGASDTVKFTVLWVTVSTKHSGTVANDNSARGEYYELGAPPSYSLGYRLIATGATHTPQKGANSLGSEFVGTVAPSDLEPSQFSEDAHVLHLDREIVNGVNWWGPTGKENQSELPSGSDTSPTSIRDDNPQSGGSSGKIYDLDIPAINAFILISDVIVRRRINFRAWAVYDGIRCSTKVPWYTRQSYKLDGPYESGTASGGSANTLTDNTKSWAPNTWAPGAIKIWRGTGAGQVRRIAANSETTVTVAANWTTQPDNTSKYWLINTSTWVVNGDATGDNQSADGTTRLSWDLKSPTLSTISPSNATNDGTVNITNLAGTSFASGVTVKLTKDGESDIEATNVVVTSVTQITCTFDLTGAATGQWNVEVTNPADSPVTLDNAFTVNAPW